MKHAAWLLASYSHIAGRRLASTSGRSLLLVASGFAYYRTAAEALRSVASKDHFVVVIALHIII
jgi:hypothetical protein